MFRDLVCELEPSAIAKSHSARDVFEKKNLFIVGSRRLEERIVHGSFVSYTNLSQSVRHAAQNAPTEEDFLEWAKQEHVAREEAKRKSRETGKKVKAERVRRSLRGGDMSWSEVAQLSTIKHIKPLLPEDKLKLQSPEWFNGATVAFLTTFPRVEKLGERLEEWILELEKIASTYGIESLRVLRSSDRILKELVPLVSGRNIWSTKSAHPRTTSTGDSIVILIEGKRQGVLAEFAKLSFVHSLEPAEWILSSSSRTPGQRATDTTLPPAGMVDTGISNGSSVDSFIRYRRGKAELRKRGLDHAEKVARLLTADQSTFPWMHSSLGDKCSIIDVAAIDGAETLASWRSSITEATLDGDDRGVVNLSANVESATRSMPASEVSFLGETLDEQSLDSDDLLIVNSAGNGGCIGMNPPADGIHVISVGAVARTPDGSYERCGYSCYGGGIAHNVKPTLVVPLKDGSQPADDSWRTQVDDEGTSFAAPVVSRLASNLLHRHYRRDEALVLMVHNAVQPGRDIFHQPTMAEFEKFGFGLPPPLEVCNSSDMSRFTLLYKEPKARKGMIRYLKLPIPEELEPYGAFIRLTAYTRAPVSALAGEEYVACEVPTKLRMIRRKKQSTAHLDLPPEPADFAQRYESHRIRYGWKWSVLRRFSKEIRFKDFKEFELRVGPVTWRDWAAPEQSPTIHRDVEVQCALTFYPLDAKSPGFFDRFQSAFARGKIAYEVPIEVGLKAEVEM